MIFIIGGAYQGKKAFANTLNGEKLFDLHEIIRQKLKSNDDIDINYESYDVITCDEVGCGVIPMDRFDIEYREVVGRTSCSIAQIAKEVYRVTAGIPTKIKG